MIDSTRQGVGLRIAGLAWLVAALAWAGPACAERLVLQDGRTLQGAIGAVSGIAENSNANLGGDTAPVKTITLIDDNLRRTFVPHARVLRVDPDPDRAAFQKIRLKQLVASAGAPHLVRLGPIRKIEPFDDFGRRTFTVASSKGDINVIQGITEISPLYTKVEGLAGAKPYVLDMRIATSSISRETLFRILSNSKVIDPTNVDDRKSLVRLLLDSERYLDAENELAGIVRDFPDQQGLEKEVRAIRQLQARQVLSEINLRREAGQNDLAFSLLENFPRDQVAGETLQQVGQMLEKYGEQQAQGKTLLEGLEKNLAAIEDAATRKRAEAAVEEIKNELNVNTIDRLADYIHVADDEKIPDSEKLALAISGWVLGANHGNQNLAVSLSLLEVRDLVQKYLAAPDRGTRRDVLEQLRKKEGNDCETVARLLEQMKPPIDTPDPPKEQPRFYELEVKAHSSDDPPVKYYLQLPPEYDPHRRYPLVVTLRGAGTTCQQQLDWWAGEPDQNGNRFGQATRHGYIVMAVEWAKPLQEEYEFTAQEHGPVLASLRDACRRFSVDTDRVFLSGHSMGGDAAWDIGVSHPDLWAGVIPIVAQAEKYCGFYRDNAELLPFYVVGGELDGEKTKTNSTVLDHYLKRRFDVTLVIYQGRGHEHFYEEIPRIFDWMGRRKREFFPKKFAVNTMRPWDYSFWWLEVGSLPPAAVIEPIDWPPKRGFKSVLVKASVNTKTIYVETGAAKVTVWLSPEIVDFDKPVRVEFKGKQLNHDSAITPDLPTLLEDVRRRGDRQHPFWAKVE